MEIKVADNLPICYQETLTPDETKALTLRNSECHRIERK